MNIKRKSGSLIVDAACCMPIFIIGLCVLLFLIAQAGIEETVHYALVQSARSSARTYAVASDQEVQLAAGAATFRLQWEAILYSEWGGDQPDSKITRLSFGNSTTLPKSNVSIDHIVRAKAETEMVLLFKKFIAGESVSQKSVAFRPFVGESIQNTHDDRTLVYVFPKDGERYHSFSCYILQGGNIETLLTSKFRKEKSHCKICNPETLPNGAKVYMFKAGGDVYHKKTCAAITKCYICIPRGDAISQGYTPCQICGGGEN